MMITDNSDSGDGAMKATIMIILYHKSFLILSYYYRLLFMPSSYCIALTKVCFSDG